MSSRRVKLNACITRVYETCGDCNGKGISYCRGKRWETVLAGTSRETMGLVLKDKPDMGCCQSCNGSGETYHDEGSHDMQYCRSEIMSCTKCGYRLP